MRKWFPRIQKAVIISLAGRQEKEMFLSQLTFISHSSPRKCSPQNRDLPAPKPATPSLQERKAKYKPIPVSEMGLYWEGFELGSVIRDAAGPCADPSVLSGAGTGVAGKWGGSQRERVVPTSPNWMFLGRTTMLGSPSPTSLLQLGHVTQDCVQKSIQS